MKGASEKNVIFRFFARHELIGQHTKFQTSRTPPSCFFANNFANICRIRSNPKSIINFWHHLKKVWMISDEKWRHTNVLLLKTFDLLNFHCLTHSALVLPAGPLHRHPGRVVNKDADTHLRKQVKTFYGKLVHYRTKDQDKYNLCWYYLSYNCDLSSCSTSYSFTV